MMPMRYFDVLKMVYMGGMDVKVRELNTKEMLGTLMVLEGYNSISTKTHRTWESIKAYLYPELAWYMSGDRNIDKIRPYSKFWDQIRNPDKTINSNYGDLVFYRKNSLGINSFDWALEALKQDQNTRKALILYNDRELFFPENKDLICNQYQQFFIRDNQLIGVVCLRSSDMIYGLTYNMPWWSLVQQQLFHRLKEYGNHPDLELGGMLAFLGSVHVYENKFELTENMLKDEMKYHFLTLSEALPLGKTFEEYMEIIPSVFKE